MTHSVPDPIRSRLHPSLLRSLLLQMHRQLWEFWFSALGSLKGEEIGGQSQTNKEHHSKTRRVNYTITQVQVTCGSLVGKCTEIKCHKYPWNERGAARSSDPLVLFFTGIWDAGWAELDTSRNFYRIMCMNYSLCCRECKVLVHFFHSNQWFHSHDTDVKA